MKTILITLLMTACFTVAKAQVSNDLPKMQNDTDKRIFTGVEVPPVFEGGMTAFSEYIAANIKYPLEAQKQNIQGKVFLFFVVEKDGSLSHIRVLRSVSKEIDEEAIRVLKNSPKWTPGFQNGKPVRVYYSLPITFSLEKK